eukprot:CAMPEP_0194281526 /NCGR_PEP_ID=MMETSP0169-20130528/20865_1 /TAXON_ID=218684 /ORGANISM="Corethron pennatum, Strain L29A3" /LENGTH=753 /DNA_ID=CAMNT_0039026599 /DNA_START=76 /DNA_END=2337 /DNA_ORIENTATION=-
MPASKSQRNLAAREELISIHSRVKRHQNIYAVSIEVIEGYIPPSFEKSDEVIKFIDSSLGDNFIFASLLDVERKLLINAMQPANVKAGNVIIKQGNVGDYFYIIADGKVNYFVNDAYVGSGTHGSSFGEMALLYDSPRAASCIAYSDCQLWKVDQKTFRNLLANKNDMDQRETENILRKVEIFSRFGPDALKKTADAVTMVVFQDGDKIIKKGHVGHVMYIIREGKVKATEIGFGGPPYVDHEYTAGMMFGERALLAEEPRAANITAVGEVSCLCLSRDVLVKVLGPLQCIFDRAMTLPILMSVPILARSGLERFEMNQLSELIEDLTFRKNTKLVNNGDQIHQSLYIIRKGKVTVTNPDGLIKTLRSGDYFGEQTLVDKNGLSNETIKVIENTTVGVLTITSIKAVIGELNRLGKHVAAKASKLDSSILLDDLFKIRILGVGSFGKVWLVSHKKTKKPFALKKISKHELIKSKQVASVIRETNILSLVDHPFVYNLVSKFQDDTSLYMLLEYLPGGELFSLIHTRGRKGMPFEHAQFYAACILESLTHLHNRCIIYRDLKPENVVIDRDGYGILIDLGFAKRTQYKTYSVCGTPEYMSPEILLSMGHDKGVDFWAFGVLIFEMIVGRSPFSCRRSSDQYALCQRIIRGKYSFPEDGTMNDVTMDIIRRLIVKQRVRRLGCAADGDIDVRNHGFFQGVHTENLLAKKIASPCVPSLCDSLDASNFDSYRDIELTQECGREDLSAHQQELFSGF